MTTSEQLLLKAADAVSALGVALRELVAMREAEQAAGSPLLTIGETCAQLKVGRTTVRKLIAAKKLETTRVGRLVRVLQTSVTTYHNRRRTS